jgi:hypothetical protein
LNSARIGPPLLCRSGTEMDRYAVPDPSFHVIVVFSEGALEKADSPEFWDVETNPHFKDVILFLA